MPKLAVTCFITKKKQQIFFPPKRRKRKMRRKKDMQVQKQCSGGCQGFLEKYYLQGGDFFKNPQGLTFTAGKRNCYLCISFFYSGENLHS
jgi:hypothetical protein